MFTKKLLAVALLTGMSQGAFAEEKKEDDKNWQAKVQLGAIFTSGNTETTSIIGKGEFKHENETFINKLELGGWYKEDEVENDDGEKEKQKTGQKFTISGQTDYKFETEGTSLFVHASHTNDKFGAIYKHYSLSAGYSQFIFKEETTFLKVDIGPGYVWGEEQDGTEIDSGMIRGAADYEWKINDYVTFTQELSVEHSFEAEKNTRTHSVTGLSSKVGDSLQVKLAVAVTNNTEVPEDTEETDVSTLITLVYDF
ncbi:DUF481 domain-containing protein [Catenovulum sp. SM1970]|uniref:DUF481 domain-containing protein n=1 Tax=Marinifaba aquimaris TaxID=2741323 RepID=UPI001573293E|nr:DUF481 domain-containing protein [Marinifaba aquimaris]NTS78893.1 DUF481 domain-containing protein [Marinifaba aquimaris]